MPFIFDFIFASIFARFWCQHASIFIPKIQQHPSKSRSQDASFFRSICALIFLRFCFNFGTQLGVMLATFSIKIRQRYLGEGFFLLDLCSSSVFKASWRPLGAIWARFGEVRASLLEVFGAHFIHNFQVFGSRQPGNQNTRQAGKQASRQPRSQATKYHPTRHSRQVS